MSEDRLAQMISMNLLARGRLSEMAGEVALDMDIYMRTLGVPNIIKERYESMSPELKAYLQSYANGVNAYIETHKKRLPLELRSEEHTSELQSRPHLVCRLLLEKKKKKKHKNITRKKQYK